MLEASHLPPFSNVRAVCAWLRPPITFAYHSGWRIESEIFSLRWRQVDLVNGTVRLEPGETKSGKGRLIYLWESRAP